MEHAAGICRVVPPPGWAEGLAAEFALDRARLTFPARVQRVDQLQRKHTAVASQRFWADYQAWMVAAGVRRKGGKLNPVFNGREVELDRLHALVRRRGGHAAVTADRAWREIANALDVRRPREGRARPWPAGAGPSSWWEVAAALASLRRRRRCVPHRARLPRLASLLPAAGGRQRQRRLLAAQALREAADAL